MPMARNPDTTPDTTPAPEAEFGTTAKWALITLVLGGLIFGLFLGFASDQDINTQGAQSPFATLSITPHVL
jgi:hypothetical protein